jgi:RNA recognition motif-containing protein
MAHFSSPLVPFLFSFFSLPDAVIRLNAYNSSLARGEFPPPLSGNIMASALMTSSMPSGVSLGVSGEGGTLTKPHREIYVGNLPPGITIPQLADFLNASMKQLGVANDQNSVVSIWLSTDTRYGFVEMRTVEETATALNSLDGVQIGIYTLKVGRPKGYVASNIPSLLPSSSAVPSSSISSLASPTSTFTSNPVSFFPPTFSSAASSEAMSNVIMVSNLPALISDDQIKELFNPFGEVSYLLTSSFRLSPLLCL